MTDVHLTRLFEWVLRKLGVAVLWSLLAAFVCGVVAAITHEAMWFYVAGIAAPAVGAFTLVAANAPMPYEVEDLEDVPSV